MEIALNGKVDVSKVKPFLVMPVSETLGQEDTLWAAFRGGSRDALNAIFEKYSRLLYSYAMNMTGDRALIADCIQDIFVELWTRRETAASGVRSVKYYLIKSLRRRILRRLSADKRFMIGLENTNEEIEFSIEFNLIQEQLSHERATQLKTALSGLSKRQQEAIYLKFYENMSYDELASVMDINVKAAYNLIGKAIILLRQVFKKDVV